nr:scarecrow-like protein 6 [Quercus suber]
MSRAYGEALEKDQRELGQIILRRISEKGSPVGKTLERLAFYLSQDSEINQGENLKQESLKNFKAAFQALYQALPDRKFAHFATNFAILEAIPNDVETIHIVDFDMGEGVQWPPMIEAIAHQDKTLKLTSMKWEEEDCNGAPLWKFKETKRRLYDQARAFGL